METIVAGENETPKQDPIGDATDEHSLIELFNQFSGFMSLVLEWTELDTSIVISKASLQGEILLSRLQFKT